MDLKLNSWYLQFAVICIGVLSVTISVGCSDTASPSATTERTTVATILPGGRDVSPALENLRARQPKQAATIDDWLTGKVEAAVATFPTVSGTCDEFITRGVSLCERSGYATATQVTLLIPSRESAPGYQAEAKPVRDQVAYLVDGRHPRLDLLAQRDDGTVLAVIGLDAAPGKIFPGGTLTNEAPVVAAYLYIAPDGTTSDMSERGTGSPPLEPIRNDERQGVHQYTILAASPAFVDWDTTINTALDEARQATPEQ